MNVNGDLEQSVNVILRELVVTLLITGKLLV